MLWGFAKSGGGDGGEGEIMAPDGRLQCQLSAKLSFFRESLKNSIPCSLKGTG